VREGESLLERLVVLGLVIPASLVGVALVIATVSANSAATETPPTADQGAEAPAQVVAS
jgi:hypothetical protein